MLSRRAPVSVLSALRRRRSASREATQRLEVDHGRIRAALALLKRADGAQRLRPGDAVDRAAIETLSLQVCLDLLHCIGRQAQSRAGALRWFLVARLRIRPRIGGRSREGVGSRLPLHIFGEERLALLRADRLSRPRLLEKGE